MTPQELEAVGQAFARAIAPELRKLTVAMSPQPMPRGQFGSVGRGLAVEAIGEVLGPEVRKLAVGVTHLTRGMTGLVPAVSAATSGLKGLAGAASPTGLKPLSQGFELLASTLGIVLVPAVVLLGASVAAAARVLSKDLEPALAKVSQWYVENVDTMVAFGKAVVDATGWLVHLAKTGEVTREPPKGMESNTRLSDFSGPIGVANYMMRYEVEHKYEQHLDRTLEEARVARKFGFPGMPGGPGGRPLTPEEREDQVIRKFHLEDVVRRPAPGIVPAGTQPAPGIIPAGTQPAAAAPRAAVPAGTQPATGVVPARPGVPEESLEGQIRKEMTGIAGSMLAAMKAAQGGPPGFGRIEDAWKRAQMAAFEDPMSAMIRQNWEKTINLLSQVLAGIRDGNAPANAVNQGRPVVAGR